jgi:beta-phosphoglucomutase
MIKLVKKTNSFQAAIFDMDGVIIDNHIFHVQAWSELCNKYQIPFEENNFRSKYFGKNNKDIFYGLMNCELNAEKIEALGEEKEKIYRELYKDLITPVKGFVPFVLTLKNSGIKIAIATSAPTSNLDFVLDNLKIRNLFDVIVDATGIIKGKPDPEIYLKASKLLNIQPTNCIVFEDSISGIKSGQNAGMKVIGLSTTHNPEELPKTSLLIKDFSEVSLGRINEVL